MALPLFVGENYSPYLGLSCDDVKLGEYGLMNQKVSLNLDEFLAEVRPVINYAVLLPIKHGRTDIIKRVKNSNSKYIFISPIVYENISRMNSVTSHLLIRVSKIQKYKYDKVYVENDK